MIIHSYECEDCLSITESYVSASEIPDTQSCPFCGGVASKIFLPSQTHPVDADWIAGVREVVDKHSDKPHVNEFLRHPTRANLKTYMQKENLRHMDKSEPSMPTVSKAAKKAEEMRVKKGMLELHHKRNAVSCSGGA